VLTIYGIPNCDACRKARRWLDSQGRTYSFHDLRSDGLTRALLTGWLRNCDWQTLLNTRSATWRNLAASERTAVDRQRAIELMLEYPTLIKRPVLEADRQVVVGFSERDYRALLG